MSSCIILKCHMSLQIWYQFLILHVKYKALKIQEKSATKVSTNPADLHVYSFSTKALDNNSSDSFVTSRNRETNLAVNFDVRKYCVVLAGGFWGKLYNSDSFYEHFSSV